MAYIQNARHAVLIAHNKAMSWTILSLITDERSEAHKGYAKCPISQFNQWPFCDSDLGLSDSKAWALNFHSILPNGSMQANQAPFREPREELKMAWFPAQVNLQHCGPSATMLQCIDVILEESPKAVFTTSQQFTILFVSLMDLFLGEEAPD